jgi:hypothetical protein
LPIGKIMLKPFLRASLILVSTLLVAPLAGAGAPPRIPSEQACRYLADYALVARALAEERTLSTNQADSILSRIYIVSHPTILDVEGRIRLTARGDKRTAQEFSLAFLHECVNKEGDVTRFLGVSL